MVRIWREELSLRGIIFGALSSLCLASPAKASVVLAGVMLDSRANKSFFRKPRLSASALVSAALPERMRTILFSLAVTFLVTSASAAPLLNQANSVANPSIKRMDTIIPPRPTEGCPLGLR